MLLSRIQDTIEKYEMFSRSHQVLIGLSGGADSVGLLLVLRELGYKVAAAHLNHGLRGAESEHDEAFTRELSRQHSIRFFAGRAELSPNQANLEAAGREARKQFFGDLVRRHGFDRIALAHNANDRAETFLMNLIRGSGPDGLTAMRPVNGNLVRPLIETPRSEIETFLRERSQIWHTDSTNMDVRFSRNRLRLDVIPSLIAQFNPNLIQTIERTVEILRDDDDLLRSLTSRWLDDHGTRDADKFVLDARHLATEPRALQRRVLRFALKHLGSTLDRVGFEHLESVRALLSDGQSGKLVEIPGGWVVTRSFDRLIVQKRTEAPVDFDYELQIPGEVHIPELRKTFRAEIVSENNSNYTPDRVFVDGGALGGYVRIRNWKPGDYYKPVGLPAGKLKKLFQRSRIPRSQRHRWPVLVHGINGASIVWVASFPVSREFSPRGYSQKIVAFEALPF